MSFSFIKQWILDRLKERTTWDGQVLIGVGVGILLVKSLLPIIAWVSIIYGVYTLVTPEEKRWTPKL